jgi:hypothetical protein
MELCGFACELHCCSMINGCVTSTSGRAGQTGGAGEWPWTGGRAGGWTGDHNGALDGRSNRPFRARPRNWQAF